MSPRPSLPASRQATIALCLILLAAGLACVCATAAQAANYKMLLCASDNGSNSFDVATNTRSPQNPDGIFLLENHCGPAPDPAGNAAFLRIAEKQSSGSAGDGAYGSISWTVPPWVAILAAGGYTRQPNAFGYGWRGRFWAEDFGGGGHHILMQGAGMPNADYRWAPTPVFSAHLWPHAAYGYYRRFVFELTCMSAGRCDNSNFNAVDANTMTLVLYDAEDSRVGFTNGSALMAGGWVRGAHAITWNASDQGSGLRWERLRVNGEMRQEINHGASCDLGWSQVSNEFARRFQPCPTGGPFGRSHVLDTATVPDGARTIEICTQDYAQAVGLNNTGSQSCDWRTIYVDNTPPGVASGLQVTSANPERYLPDFDATFSLPPNHGSPIVKVHYRVIDAAGEVVQPIRTVQATNPTELRSIAGPRTPGDYRLQVWLEDQVGWVSPASTAPIPRDTTPPPAPQGLSAATPSSRRSVEGFDLRWRNITDAGSPIDAAHYQVLNGSSSIPWA
jgi:hypothetical protein